MFGGMGRHRQDGFNSSAGDIIEEVGEMEVVEGLIDGNAQQVDQGLEEEILGDII
jgi:hypothetical protein